MRENYIVFSTLGARFTVCAPRDTDVPSGSLLPEEFDQLLQLGFSHDCIRPHDEVFPRLVPLDVGEAHLSHLVIYVYAHPITRILRLLLVQEL